MANSFASRLLNYVEPVSYNGVFKTAFYSEFGTNFNIGDKVFIINGNYDSNDYLNTYTYSNNTDGYTVIDIDKCRIVLDIDYTGELAYNEDSYDNYVRLHTVTSQREFDYINTINTNTYGTYSNKYEYRLSNDIIYSSASFSGTTSIFGYNNGITQSGFFQKRTTTNNWMNISASFSAGIIGFKTTGSAPTYSLTFNNKILVVGENITYNNVTFTQRGVYIYDTINSAWKLDKTSNKAFISKLNFRKGKFAGTWNDGVFGTYEQSIDWDVATAVWNSGIFLNSNWKTGTINSRNSTATTTNYTNSLYAPSFITTTTASYNILTINSTTASRTIEYNNPVKQTNNTPTPSYYTKLDSNTGLPVYSSDYSNNKGFGFNYIIDSTIEEGSIINGNFENCNIGLTNYGVNSIDVYYGLNFTYSIQISGGNYNLCDINTAAFNNSTIVNSNIINSNISNSKLSSNQIYNSVANGEYNTDNSINVINADLWSYIPFNSTQKRGVLKLFINSSDLNKLTDFQTLYIDNINKDVYLSSWDEDSKIHLNIENKYILDHFKNAEITSTTGSIVVSVKTISDNKYKSYIYGSGLTYSNIFIDNPNQYASIDFDLSETLAWYTDGTSSYYINSNPVITTDNVSKLFANTNIINGEFASGIFIGGNWKNGNNFNDVSNNILKSGASYSIKVLPGSTNSIRIDVSDAIYNKYQTIEIGDYIWLNGFDYATNSSSTTVYGILNNSVFKVTSLTSSVLADSRRYVLTEITNNIYNNSMTASGRFFIKELYPSYLSINKFKIDRTNINKGTFKNTLILNSNIINNDFNNLDKSLTISNINKLKLINILFKDDGNTINSGLVYNSHILNTKWNNGISFNNVIKNATFSNGLFKNGYWINGVFNNGVFFDSPATITSTSSYELTTQYRSWRNGSFNNGQIYTSTWIDGTFNGGRFYNSHWYGGVFNNGILGIKNSQYYTTTLGYYQNIGTGSTATIWNYGTVESAIIGGSSSVTWNNGIFNNGEFTSNGGSYSSTWNNGSFNGGKFTKLAKWKNGIFNNGKFLSYFGHTMSNSTYSTDYSWENGKFNGGQFGQPIVSTNSTWYNGEFNNGYFYGKVWNYGIFTKGNFYGSSLTSSFKNEQNFINYYTSSYYGLWRDGYVVDSIHIGDPDKKIYTNIKRTTSNKKSNNDVKLSNMLWLNGTFSHPDGIADNIVWLDGTFLKGQFNDSAFNPFVDRTLSGYTTSGSQSFNFNNSCKWYNGTFDGGTFYISEWKDGNFMNGYMSGGIWRKGTWYYGYADNIYWENGTWKNGNWYGTNYDYTVLATASQNLIDPKTQYILYNVANVLGTSSLHLLNVFTGSTSAEILYDPNISLEASSDYRGWTQAGVNSWTWSTFYTTDTGSMVTITYNDNYYHYGSGQTNIIYGLSQTGVSSFTTNIFEPFTAYSVELSIHMDYTGGVTTYPTSVEVYLGYTTSIVSCVHGTNNFYFSLSSNADLWASYSPNFGIKKLAGIPVVATFLLSASVKSTNVSYNLTRNNAQYTPYGTSPTSSTTITLPPLIKTEVADSGLVSIQFGNGRFKSGVWENGVWNNGWRNDETLTRCIKYPTAFYIKVSRKTHRIQLQFLDQNQSLFTVGDWVSVGNITSIDINSNRKLIKDKFKVIYVGATNIVLEIDLNYPIQEIKQDSDIHLIYLSRNIWLSGAFLNGYFNGIWNYGLFKGYPHITYMQNSHLIDGIFDGGRFLSTTASGPSGSSYDQYNTGLIQNFEFKDNNRAVITSNMDRSTNLITRRNSYKYDSWIDVNYVLEAQTNLYRDQNIYSDTAGLGPYYHGPVSKQNFNGLITKDVLSSKSHFRNAYDNNISTYNLGIKYTKYINYLDQIGDFNTLFSNRIPALGLSKFTEDGWTYSSLIQELSGSSTYSGIGVDPKYFSLYNEDNSLNIISTTYAVTSGGTMTTFPYTSIQHYIMLDNTNTFDIPNKRYSMFEFEILSFTGFPGPSAYTTRSYADNALYYPPVISSLMSAASYSVNQMVVNPLLDSNGLPTNTIYREYFYNRHGLEMLITAGGYAAGHSYPVGIKFGYVYFYEIDMIPFFSYTGVTTSYIDNDIRLPWTAIAPYIDYTSSNFNYIGNIDITVDSSLISSVTSITLPTAGNIFTDIDSASSITGI